MSKFEKSYYIVYQCHNPNDCFDYDACVPLYENHDLGNAHHFAYTLWLEDKTKAYTIIQPYDGSCRGGYGLLVDE